MVPSILQMSKKEFRPSSWRILAAISGVPCLIVASFMTLLPSSPRYLIYQRRPIEALTVLKQIYAINNSQHADNFNVRAQFNTKKIGRKKTNLNFKKLSSLKL